MSAPVSMLVERGWTSLVSGDPSTRITGVRQDSRCIEPGDLFVALRGASHDGTAHIHAAIARGAAAVLSDALIERAVTTLHALDPRAVLGPIAECIYGSPTADLEVVGVTGTNGKTTTTWLLDEALHALGARPSLLGTIEARGPGVREVSSHTTPEADTIARFAKQMRDRGATHLVMEVSSHALALHRADGVRFAVGIFTNLSQDHLDFHGSMEAYFAAKSRLFSDLAPRHALVVVDTEWGRGLHDRLRAQGRSVIGISTRPTATTEVRCLREHSSRSGMSLLFETPWGRVEFTTPLVGHHNVENLLCVAATLGVLGFSADAVGRALAHVRGAPGRLERVSSREDRVVLVDYAHTPDALAHAIQALRPLTPGRLIVVFGCGGDRDRGKRPLMAAAARAASIALVTSDNPRTEDPEAIIQEILPGFQGSPRLSASSLLDASGGFAVEVDRRRAIRLAIEAARAGDTVLIAGKGHEDYQIIGHTKTPFDDRVEARRALEGGP